MDINISKDYMALSRLPKSVWKLLTTPTITFGVCVMAALAALPFSLHFSLLAISVAYVFLAYYVERKHLGALILPPLVILAVFNFATGSLGPVLLADNIFSSDITPILATHIVDTVTFPILLITYWHLNLKTPPMVILENNKISSTIDNKQMHFISFTLIVFTIALHYVNISTGAGDRGQAGSFIVDTPYGFWSYFTAFSNLQFIAYMLIPYAYRCSGKPVRLALIILFSVYILFSLANSERGAILYPLIFITLGYWMIGGSFKRTTLTLVFLTVFTLFLVPRLGSFRGSGALEATDLKDLPGRLNLLIESQKQYDSSTDADSRDNRRVIGQALLGVGDPIIYSDTPSLFPFAGWERISDVLYIWMPSMFFPDKPQLLDGNMITSEYTGKYYERSGLGIRLQADLYRRFGWSGVFFGYLLYSIILSMVVRYAFRSFADKRKRIWGLMFLLFITGFVRGAPAGTLLGTIWIFFYDYPKYLIVLWLVVHISGFFTGDTLKKQEHGQISYD